MLLKAWPLVHRSSDYRRARHGVVSRGVRAQLSGEPGATWKAAVPEIVKRLVLMRCHVSSGT